MKIELFVKMELVLIDEKIEERLVFLDGRCHLLKIFRVMRTKHHKFEIIFLEFGKHLSQIWTVVQIYLIMKEFKTIQLFDTFRELCPNSLT